MDNLSEIYRLVSSGRPVSEEISPHISYQTYGVHDLVDASSTVTVHGDGWLATSESDEHGVLGLWSVYGDDDDGRTASYEPSPTTVSSSGVERVLDAIRMYKTKKTTASTIRIYGQVYCRIPAADGPIVVRTGFGGIAGDGWKALPAGTWPGYRSSIMEKTLFEVPLVATFSLNDGTTLTKSM